MRSRNLSRQAPEACRCRSRRRFLRHGADRQRGEASGCRDAARSREGDGAPPFHGAGKDGFARLRGEGRSDAPEGQRNSRQPLRRRSLAGRAAQMEDAQVGEGSGSPWRRHRLARISMRQLRSLVCRAGAGQAGRQACRVRAGRDEPHENDMGRADQARAVRRGRTGAAGVCGRSSLDGSHAPLRQVHTLPRTGASPSPGAQGGDRVRNARSE